MTTDQFASEKDPTETVLVKHRAFNDAYLAIQECYEAYGLRSQPPCRVLTGPSGSGKSTLIKTFEQEHPKSEGAGGSEFTSLCVTVPPQVTIRSFAEEFLTVFKDPYPTRGSAADLGRRIDKALGGGQGGHSVRVVFLQEAQRFVDSRFVEMWDLGNFPRERIESSGSSFVLSGLDYTEAVVDSNDQLQRLFDPSIEFKAFDWYVKDERTEFRAFLRNLKTKLSYVYDFPEIEEPELAFRLHYASYGLIGYLMKIVRGAAGIAKASKTRVITEESLSDAFEAHIRRKTSGMCNPFRIPGFCPENAPPQLSPHDQAIAKRAAMNGQNGRKKRAPRLSAKGSSGI